jgi:hypothetical protein
MVASAGRVARGRDSFDDTAAPAFGTHDTGERHQPYTVLRSAPFGPGLALVVTFLVAADVTLTRVVSMCDLV